MNTNVNDLMSNTFDKIKAMVDVDSVMGTPITTPDGTTIIPVCKINYGFASGGSDLPSKSQPTPTGFGGGAGGAVTVTPTVFLVVKDGDAKVIQIEPFSSSLDRAIQMAPDVIDKVSSMLKKKSEEKKAKEEGEKAE